MFSEISQQTFVLIIRLDHTSSRSLQDVLKTSSRRLQDIFKTSCQDVLQKRLQDIFKTSSRRFEDLFKTSCKDAFKMLTYHQIELFDKVKDLPR